MGSFLAILLIFGLITFSTYMIVGIIRDWREKKKGKIHNKGDDTE